MLLSLKKDEGACADVAAAEAAELGPGTSRATVLTAGLGCAAGGAPRDAKREAQLGRLVELALRDARSAEGRVLADDCSALFEELVATKKKLGDADGARALASEWAAFLEGEAAKAKSADARAVFDSHRLLAYLALGDPSRAVPMLEASERDLPGDYNPPARLARAYLEMRRLDDADKAADRAIARVYGPRAMRVLEVKADIAKARGDVAKEREALEQALAPREKSVLTAGQKKVRDGLAKRLAELPARASEPGAKR